ncbi:MAG: MaoC family dehydratase [Nocardioides sp.]|uniref:MaoC family dehydratase n=1 Tax=Nocardioides sp. TaxID=35761 RepID=UPI003D6BD343
MRTFTTLEEVSDAAGTEVGTGEWLQVDQDRVTAFADATGDHQWIHIDEARAKEGPFGGTIAHGYLTLSLLPYLGASVYSLETPGAKLNYGLNKVRFPTPVLVGSRVRAVVTFGEVTELPTGLQLVIKTVIEIEDAPKPACVAEAVVLLLES